MNKNTKAGLLLLGSGTISAMSAIRAIDHGSSTLAVIGTLLSGAVLALGVAVILTGLGHGSANRRPEDADES